MSESDLASLTLSLPTACSHWLLHRDRVLFLPNLLIDYGGRWHCAVLAEWEAYGARPRKKIPCRPSRMYAGVSDISCNSWSRMLGQKGRLKTVCQISIISLKHFSGQPALRSARAPLAFMTIVGTGNERGNGGSPKGLSDAATFWAVGVMQFSEY